jgi:hypothetical protein
MEASPDTSTASDAVADDSGDSRDSGDSPDGCGAGRVACFGVCADTSSDAKNCGACGHDCLGGSCQNGECQPVILVSGQSWPIALAESSGYLYWTNRGTAYNAAGGTVMKCATTGCNNQPTLLASAQNGIAGIAVDSSNVVWADVGNNGYTDGAVFACPVSGCNGQPTQLAAGGAPSAVFVDSTRAYWTADVIYEGGLDSTVMACAVGGCSKQPTQLTPFGYGVGAVDSTSLYLGGSGGGLMKCPLSGCNGQPTLVCAQGAFGTVAAVDALHVFFFTNAGLETCPIDAVDGQAITLVSMPNGTFGGTAADSTYVYWTDRETPGSVFKCAKVGCGGQPSVLATGQNRPEGIVVDSTSIFWADNGSGDIMRLAK